MGNYYYDGKVSMKPDMNKFDCICEEEGTFEIPGVRFIGEGDIYDEEIFSWTTDTMLVARKTNLIKYTASTFSEMFITNERGETNWIDGRLANILGVDICDADAFRTKREHCIIEYDLEKSQKRIYKVVLDKTLDMSDIEICEIKRIIDDEKNND